MLKLNKCQVIEGNIITLYVNMTFSSIVKFYKVNNIG